MSQAIANQLFLTYMGRAADVTWQTSTATQLNSAAPSAALQKAFYNVAVAEGVYSASDSAATLVNKIFLNLYGTAATSYEQTAWGNLISNGTIAVESAAWTLFSSYTGATNVPTSYQLPCQSKLVAMDAYTAQLASNATANLALAQGGTSATAARTWLTAVNSQATAVTKIGTVATDVGASSTFSLTGKLADGYIRGATIFADTNGDGIWNAGEIKATTDANGSFTLTGASGKIIASGGTDNATNLPFTGTMTAPAGSAMVNSLTTLMQSMVDSGKAASVAAAQAQVLKALGLPSSVNLQTLDAIGDAVGSGSTAVKQMAAQVQAAAAKVANILVQGASAMQGAANDITATTAMSKMAAAMASNFSAATTTVDLTQTETLKTMMTAAAVGTNAATKVGASINDLASLMSSGAGKIDAAMTANPTDFTAALSQMAQVQVVVQGNMADSIKSGMAAGSVANTVTSFAGTAFDNAITAAAGAVGVLTSMVAVGGGARGSRSRCCRCRCRIYIH